MDALRNLSLRAETLVDQQGHMLADPLSATVVGITPLLPGERLLHGLQTDLQSGLTRRYLPSHPVGESCSFGYDFSSIIPLGLGISSGRLDIFQNVVPPVSSSDWAIGAVTVRGRALYASLSGGVDATDYQLVWTAVDTQGNIWPRTALVLCAATA